MTGLRIIAASVTVVWACSSHTNGTSPIDRELAYEFVTAQPTAKAHAGWSEEVLLTPEAVNYMANITAARGDRLVAVIHSQNGVHPYSVFAVIEDQRALRVVETHMFWGMVRSKSVSRIALNSLESVMNLGQVSFECAEEYSEDHLFGEVLLHWVDSNLRYCEGGWGTEAASRFWLLLNSVLEDTQVTFAPSMP